MYVNYAGEEIPDLQHLLKLAEESLMHISLMEAVALKDNIVDLQSDEYIGRRYFSKNVKNTRAHHSINYNDFSGLYVFYENNAPIYVGISNTIIRRLKSHLYGMKNNESSLVYLISRYEYEKNNGKGHHGTRNDFPFPEYRDKVQNEMKKKWSIKTIEMKNGYELSFIEIYIATALKTKWNSFHTH